MPMLDTITSLFSRPAKISSAAEVDNEPGSRLERMVARQHRPAAKPSFEATLSSMEEECSRPLYDPSVYNSLGHEPEEA